MKFKDIRFDQSSYQRPNSRHRCGRSRFWRRSCWQGPSLDGVCGGTRGCQPAKVGDRYQCTRPEHAGGACEQGPFPDGRCCQTRLPCVPRHSLRAWRGRVSLLVVVFVVALIASLSGFSPWSDSAARPWSVMSDAGPLSAAHGRFNSNESCGSCHQAHKKTGLQWLAVAFTDQDMSDGCLNCHRFEGDARAAHQNPELAKASKQVVPELQCTTCHAEHLGQNANIIEAASATCRNCHQQTINDFGNSHPEFSAIYPYENPHTIYFDHKSHINEYFVDSKWTQKPNRDAEFAKRAASACTSCHEVEDSTRAVVPKTFSAMCSGCHQQQIHDRPLIVMTGDEAAQVLVALATVIEHEFADDSEALAQGTIKQMKEQSLQPLMELTGKDSERLWAGLSAVEILAAASAWAEEEDMEHPMPEMQQAAGWHTGENDDGDQSLFYRADKHADTVMRAWIETFVKRVKAADEVLKEPLSEALDSLLDAKSGPGACGKCHASGIRNALLEASAGRMLWGYQAQETNRHTPYRHGPHINLTGSQEGCDSCHQFAKGVDSTRYFRHQGIDPDEFVSVFKPIKKELCSECHNPNQTSDSCLTCHQYHGKFDFRIGFMPKPAEHEAVVSSAVSPVLPGAGRVLDSDTPHIEPKVTQHD